MFIIFTKLTKKEAEENILKLKQWFEEHPQRRVCYTSLFKVRKNHIEEDVYKHTENGEI